MDFPVCFDTEENFEAWVSLAESQDDGRDPRISFCNYCTKEYQSEMTIQGRCQNPTFTEFDSEDDDG